MKAYILHKTQVPPPCSFVVAPDEGSVVGLFLDFGNNHCIRIGQVEWVPGAGGFLSWNFGEDYESFSDPAWLPRETLDACREMAKKLCDDPM